MWEPYNVKEHGHLFIRNVADRVDRCETFSGRLCVDNTPTNCITRNVSCASLHQDDTLGHLTRCGRRLYVSFDVSTAFPRLRLSKALKQWLGISVGTQIYVPCGGPLGWAPLPAIWTASVASIFSNDKISEVGYKGLMKILMKHKDLITPFKGWVGHKQW